MNPHKDSDGLWMKKALIEAERAMKKGELPIATILVSGNNELSRAHTQTKRKGSRVAHGELFALLSAGKKIFTAKRPLVIYTTLEPCLMCLGAAMQCRIDEIVYAMPAKPDGGSIFVSSIRKRGLKVPIIRKSEFKEDAIKLMKQFILENPKHFGLDYAKAVVKEQYMRK